MICLNEKLNPYAFELRYFDCILMIGQSDDLLMRKAEMVFNKDVRYPDYLKIFDSCGFPWILDIPFDKKRASKFIANAICHGEAFVSEDFYENYGLAKPKKKVDYVEEFDYVV